MSESFRGELSQKVDSKARVSIPAAFRRVLETGDPSWPETPRPKVVMVYGDERRRFVECYSITEMKRVEALIARLPKGSPSRRLLERNLITVDPATCATSAAGIHAIGDIATYPGKLKLILTGFAEAASAAHAIHGRVHPGTALHFEYSTSKGVAGFAA